MTFYVPVSCGMFPGGKNPCNPPLFVRRLLPAFRTVVPAPVAAIAPVWSCLDTRGLALFADRAVVLHPGGLFFLFHEKRLGITL
jgi:hypothetical protein